MLTLTFSTPFSHINLLHRERATMNWMQRSKDNLLVHEVAIFNKRKDTSINSTYIICQTAQTYHPAPHPIAPVPLLRFRWRRGNDCERGGAMIGWVKRSRDDLLVYEIMTRWMTMDDVKTHINQPDKKQTTLYSPPPSSRTSGRFALKVNCCVLGSVSPSKIKQ